MSITQCLDSAIGHGYEVLGGARNVLSSTSALLALFEMSLIALAMPCAADSCRAWPRRLPVAPGRAFACSSLLLAAFSGADPNVCIFPTIAATLGRYIICFPLMFMLHLLTLNLTDACEHLFTSF